MTVIIVGIVVAWVVFSTLLVTMACVNSSRLSQMEEPLKGRPVRARPRARKAATPAHSAQMPVNAETS
jgi:hypothetical protein